MSKLDDYIWYLQKLASNGGPYSQWDGSWPPGPGAPFYMDSGSYSYEAIRRRGANCSGILNLPLWWVGLKPVGGMLAWGEYLIQNGQWWERFVPNKDYPVGTFLIQPYGTGDGGEGHIAVVSSPEQWIVQSDSYYGINEQKTAMQQHYYTPWSYAAFHPELLPPEVGGETGGKVEPRGPGEVPTKYPGNCADPEPVAHYFAYVAEEEFGLPGMLPVMTSVVELRDAWTAPGCVDNIPGYLYALDHDSVGYFQQRPSMGWGTAEQCADADYALRKFCEVAASMKDHEWHKETTDRYALGRWCQAVQRSAYPNRYGDEGYSLAKILLEGYKKPDPTKPEPGGKELTQWEKWGWFEWPDDEKWDLKYYPAPGKTSPVEPEKPKTRRAKVKDPEVEYYVDEGGAYVVIMDGEEHEMDEGSFRLMYKEAE